MEHPDPAYFLYHSIGQYPGKSEEMAAALAEFAHIWGAPDDAQWNAVLSRRQEYIDLWRAILDAPEGSLTSSENVTQAFYTVLTGLPRDRLEGKKVLIGTDCFPSLHFMLAGMAPRLGFDLVTVPMRQGAHWVEDEDILSAWDEEVGLALITFVTSTSSHLSDVDAMLAHGRAMGSLVGVDVTQGAGLLPFSVQKTPADFVISTSLKWMCGTPGAGVLQMRPDLIADVKPELRGWFSQDNPFAWDLDTFDYAPDARRFDNGTPSVVACLGSIPALRWHAKQTDLLQQNQSMTPIIVEEVQKLGLTLASPADVNARGGSVMVQLPDHTPAPDLVDKLRGKGIYVDARSQTLRMSPGAITEERHLDRLFSGLKEALK